jgi:hypothetical protein
MEAKPRPIVGAEIRPSIFPAPEVRPRRVFEEVTPTAPAGCMSMFGLGLCIGVFVGFIIAYLMFRKQYG